MRFNMNNQMPYTLKEKIKNDIHQRLNPSWSMVFMKLASIQFFSSFVVLLFCPQFNLGFFPHSYLGHLFMSWGEFACNIACGALFTGTGLLFTLYFLTSDELRVLRLNEFSIFFLVCLLSLGAFMIFGVEFQFILFIAWIIGAMISGIAGLEIYWGFKKNYGSNSIGV
jgi:hypothetical protein